MWSRVRRNSLYWHMLDPRRMTLSDQYPWIFICSIIYYGAFSHAFFSSDALLLKSGTQAQRKGSSFCPHNFSFLLLISINYYYLFKIRIFFLLKMNGIFFCKPMLCTRTYLFIKLTKMILWNLKLIKKLHHCMICFYMTSICITIWWRSHYLNVQWLTKNLAGSFRYCKKIKLLRKH